MRHVCFPNGNMLLRVYMDAFVADKADMASVFDKLLASAYAYLADVEFNVSTTAHSL
jgi:hypothetical protein